MRGSAEGADGFSLAVSPGVVEFLAVFTLRNVVRLFSLRS